MSELFEQRTQELHNYIELWKKETMALLGMANTSDSSVGVSFMPPSFQVPQVPEVPVHRRGFYVSNDGIVVEVTGQPSRDTIELTVIGNESRFHLISAKLFEMLFTDVSVSSIVKF